jgi:hypothetical protein
LHIRVVIPGKSSRMVPCILNFVWFYSLPGLIFSLGSTHNWLPLLEKITTGLPNILERDKEITNALMLVILKPNDLCTEIFKYTS